MIMLKVEIDFFEFSRLFKASFIFRDSLKYRKSISIIYFKNINNHNKYYTENHRIADIIEILLEIAKIS